MAYAAYQWDTLRLASMPAILIGRGNDGTDELGSL